ANRDRNANAGSRLTRCNVERAAKILNALAHSAKSDTRHAGASNFRQLLWGNAFPGIFNFESDSITGLAEPNRRSRAGRMTVNVGKRFLDNAEDSRFQVSRHSPEFGIQLQFHMDAAALLKPVRKPSQRGKQSHLVQ